MEVGKDKVRYLFLICQLLWKSDIRNSPVSSKLNCQPLFTISAGQFLLTAPKTLLSALTLIPYDILNIFTSSQNHIFLGKKIGTTFVWPFTKACRGTSSLIIIFIEILLSQCNLLARLINIVEHFYWLIIAKPTCCLRCKCQTSGAAFISFLISLALILQHTGSGGCF